MATGMALSSAFGHQKCYKKLQVLYFEDFYCFWYHLQAVLLSPSHLELGTQHLAASPLQCLLLLAQVILSFLTCLQRAVVVFSPCFQKCVFIPQHA